MMPPMFCLAKPDAAHAFYDTNPVPLRQGVGTITAQFGGGRFAVVLKAWNRDPETTNFYNGHAGKKLIGIWPRRLL